MINPIVTNIRPARASRASRLILAAALLVAFALVILAIDTQHAQADVDIDAANITNGSFETAGIGSLPFKWGGVNLDSTDKRVCNQSYAGSCSFKFAGDDSSKWIEQCMPYTGTNIGDQWKLKGWTKGKLLVPGSGDGRAFIFLEFYEGASPIGGEAIAVPMGTTPWTMRQVTATAVVDYDKICISVLTATDSGIVWFDKLILTKLP